MLEFLLPLVDNYDFDRKRIICQDISSTLSVRSQRETFQFMFGVKLGISEEL